MSSPTSPAPTSSKLEEPLTEDDNPDETGADITEYAVDHLVAKRSDDHGTFYKVRWHVFSAKDDTWELEGNIPANMRHRFDQQQTKKTKRR